MQRLALGTLLLLAMSGAAGVRAQENESAGASDQRVPLSHEAQQRFELGRQAFEQGDFATALTEWQRAYDLLEHHPRREYVTYNMARAHEELGRTRQALELYERFLARTGSDAPNRTDAQRHVRELQLRLQLAEADVSDPSPPVEGAQNPTVEPSVGFSPSPLGIAIASIGAAAVIAGGIIGGLALAQDAEARPDCTQDGCSPEAHSALVEAHTLANVADGLLWGGLGVLAAGAVLVFVLGESGGTDASAACTGNGCVAVVRGRF